VSQVRAGSIERPEAPKFVVGFARFWWSNSCYTVG